MFGYLIGRLGSGADGWQLSPESSRLFGRPCGARQVQAECNREDGCTGAFWEGRFRGAAVRDREALLAVGVTIDLNPVAAGIAATPEQAE
ncbi:hypothetical protein [Aquisphaera insulae]|uniref:hypothetical protein n=1 Tax=Aquisphaera insulae TaxID=2712864 RepID=UPI0013EAE2E9|nr:hypothetical protein [Aquisphaera insulae]